MKTGANLKNRQGGAVAVIVGFSLVLLIGFLAMVIDLGHLYLAKTELQNGADAAALAGVKELNGTGDGVASAIGWAQQTAGKNVYDFDKPIFDTTDTPTDNDIIDIWVGSCPDDGKCIMMPVSAGTTISDADAAGKTFLKVHTRNRDLVAWFAPIWNIFHVSTYGMAVAGPIVRDIAPLGVCAVDKTRQEHGFIRGVAYNVPELNPIGLQAHPLLINPVDVPPGNCDPSNGAADFMRPFICQGKAVGPSQIPGEIYANTGGSWGPVEAGLNSRFDLYPPSGQCDAATAPPDANIKQFIAAPAGANPASCPANSNNPACGYPRDWMEPGGNTIPTQQGITITGIKPIDKTVSSSSSDVRIPPATALFPDYGALWSYSRERNFATGGDHTLDDWCGETDPLLPCSATSLYKGRADQTASGYPTTGETPYQYGLAHPTSSKYFDEPRPANRPGKADRRVLNLLIIDCEDAAYPMPGPGAACATLSVIGIGKFFMQTPADFTGNTRKLYGEFAGLLPPGLLKPQYVLFK